MCRIFNTLLKKYTQPYLKSSLTKSSSLSKNSPHFYHEHLIASEYEVPALRLSQNKDFSPRELQSAIYQKPKFLSILTYNVWFSLFNARNRHLSLAKVIADSGADIICLQEVTNLFYAKLLQQNQSKNQLKEYFISPLSPTNWYSTFILSKYPCRFYRRIFENSAIGRSLLTAVFQFEQPDKRCFKLAVNCLHLESQSASESRIQQLKTTKQINKGMDLSIIAGDFNFGDQSMEQTQLRDYKDLWREGKRHYSSWATQQLKQTGFTMPKSKSQKAWRPDRIFYKSKNDEIMQVGKMNEIEIVGDFGIEPFADQLFTGYEMDELVRTPSDHFGLIGKLYI